MSKVTILTKPNRIVIASKGVQGPPGDVTPELEQARDDAVQAASDAAGHADSAQDASDAAVAAASAASGSASAAADSANLAEQARLLGATIGFATKADMDASLAHPDGTLALVTSDATASNNGTYRKTGASGSGAWVQSADRVTGLEGRVSALEDARHLRGVLLAASNAPADVKNRAGVICTGVDDHVQINAALAAVSKGERVFLSAGQFNVGGTVVVPDGKGIIGAGKAHTVIKLQDAGSRSLTNYWWRTGAVGADVIMTTAFVDDATRTQYQARDMEMRSFTIVGNTDAIMPGNANLIGLMVTSCADTVVSDVDVNDINWHEPSAIDPTKGLGIITRYCDGVDIIRCNPKRAQYECLGMFDNSNNTRFIDCYPQDAGRTVTQVHRGCVDSWIIRGHSRNTTYMRLADEQTKALTVHGVPGDRIVNLRVIDHDATCSGVGTGTAIDWFGEQQGCSYSGNAYSQNGAAATFSGNIIGNFNVSGRFTSDSVGNSYALTLRGIGVRASNIYVEGDGCRGLDLWTAQDIKVSGFSISSANNAMSISNLHNVEISEGSVISSGIGIFSTAAIVTGKFHITNVSVETSSNLALSLSGAVAEGGRTVLRGLDLGRADGGIAATIRHSKATLEGSRIGGLLRIQEATGVIVRFNQYRGIQYLGTTEQDNVVQYNLATP